MLMDIIFFVEIPNLETVQLASPCKLKKNISVVSQGGKSKVSFAIKRDAEWHPRHPDLRISMRNLGGRA